jgi:hypothetical protein
MVAGLENQPRHRTGRAARSSFDYHKAVWCNPALQVNRQKGPFLSVHPQLRKPLRDKGLESDKNVVQNTSMKIGYARVV